MAGRLVPPFSFAEQACELGGGGRRGEDLLGGQDVSRCGTRPLRPNRGGFREGAISGKGAGRFGQELAVEQRDFRLKPGRQFYELLVNRW